MLSCKDQYTLPTITMTGGGLKNLYFHIYDKASGNVALVDGCTARFSIVNCASRLGGEKLTTVLQKELEVVSGDNDGNVLRLKLDASDTVHLNGKYIYQIWVIGKDGIPEEPQQGELYVKRNTDPDYISTGGE